jgi:D-arabinan exo alpha-(1,3)/(1,5)-arabinofuranosidase (non-reducing end)
MGLLDDLTRVRDAKTLRCSSWDTTGGNRDAWPIEPGETKVIADVEGPGKITHIWMTQGGDDPLQLRKTVVKMYWDGEKRPSVLVPLGDFFCLGHCITNSFCSLPFSASANQNNTSGVRVALNCYLQMPFRRSARIEVVNEGDRPYAQYFYVDYERYDADPFSGDLAYFHASWHRENPTDGWGPEVRVNSPESNIPNLDGAGNYLILDAKGRGHYIGCNISVTNFHGSWWGEGDDMIFVDGEAFPPAIHGTGSEDYFNQAYGMQDNAFLFNGSSVYEGNNSPPGIARRYGHRTGGYQTSYVFHLTNPIHFRESIRATIEHGHANHTCNDWCSTAYWYQLEPHKALRLLPVGKRLPVTLDYVNPRSQQTKQTPLKLTKDMKAAKAAWKKNNP